ncbi:DUF3696 domain-containing protein [Halosimplex marinum]|uniref:AAA family ATPase n=1 Tax=Halosimplex marinum TaxID=3396620 RepID=UPI003F5693D3
MNLDGVKSYSIKNYKSIINSGDIDIDGISVILGPNSSGKTNLIEPLLLLKQSTDTEGLNLTLNGKSIKAGTYSEVVKDHEIENDIVYSFKYDYSNEPKDDDRPLECPICSKNYIEEGWYRRHIRTEHPKFWNYAEESIEIYEDFPPDNPYLELAFGYDEEVERNRLKRVEMGYPEEIGSLYLSYISAQFKRSSVSVSVIDVNDNQILDVELENEDHYISNPQGLIAIEYVLRETISNFAKGDRGRQYLRYSKNQPYIPDQKIPSAELHSKELSKIFQLYNKGEDPDNRSDLNINEELENLARGLINRIASSVEISSKMLRYIDNVGENISHVGPLRRSPQRIYFGSGADSRDSHSQGVNIEEKILRKAEMGNSPILEKTNQWLKQTGFDCKLDIESVEIGDIYQLKVIEDGLSVNLADSGFGLSQALPILVECIYMGLREESPTNSPRAVFDPQAVENQYLTIIEEPEIHLNPKIESAMADFFININEEKTGLMLETHSEHLLNRIQRRIADGTIDDKDRVSVYFVSKDEAGSTVEHIEMDERGRFDEWPEGFFQDDLTDAIEMLKESTDLNDLQ